MDDDDLLVNDDDIFDDDDPLLPPYDGTDDLDEGDDTGIDTGGDDPVLEPEDPTPPVIGPTPSMPDANPNSQTDSGNDSQKSYYIFSKDFNRAKAVHSLQIINDDDEIISLSEDGNSTVIDFSGRSTWNHYRLIPSSRPVINPPDFRSNFIEIPGMDGLMDVSTLLTGGHPLYGRRKGDIEFYVTRDYDGYYTWAKAYSNIMSFLHGQMVKCILMDDPSFYYRGRMTVNQWRSEKDWSKIVLNYDFEPYKYSVFSTADRWLWDPFDFAEGVITNPVDFFREDGYGFEIYNEQEHWFDNIYAGSARVAPSIVVFNPNYSSETTTYDTIKLNIGLYRGVKRSDGTYSYDWENRVIEPEYARVNAKRRKQIGNKYEYQGTLVTPYFLNVKNGMYQVRVRYLRDSTVQGSPDHIRVGLLYRYGSL